MPDERVVIAICTRGRPQMLRTTLRSLAILDFSNIDCHFVVIENNATLTVGAVVEELVAAVGTERVVAHAEPRLGIAFARNRALDIGLALNARWLAFIDDDEVADPRWIIGLVRAARTRQLHLVGGPVRLLGAPSGSTLTESMVWRGIEKRSRNLETKARNLTSRGQDGKITIATGNWLADLDFLRLSGLRFDEAIGLSGGEDTAFHRALRAAAGKSGWAVDAIMYERWPRERLTLAYQFRRGHDQTLARYRAKFPDRTIRAVTVTIGIALFKIIGGTLRIVLSVFDRGASLARAARAFGAAAGVIGALRGRRSKQYETVSGR